MTAGILRQSRGERQVRHANPMSHSTSRRRRWYPTRSLGLVWLVLGLPALLGAALAALTILGNLGSPASFDLVLPRMLPVVALFLVAVIATAAAGLERRARRRRTLTVITAVLLVVVAAPLVLTIVSAATEEWCQGQPGGRGGTSVSSKVDVPVVCR